jgi:hypothetical protein
MNSRQSSTLLRGSFSAGTPTSCNWIGLENNAEGPGVSANNRPGYAKHTVIDSITNRKLQSPDVDGKSFRLTLTDVLANSRDPKTGWTRSEHWSLFE